MDTVENYGWYTKFEFSFVGIIITIQSGRYKK